MDDAASTPVAGHRQHGPRVVRLLVAAGHDHHSRFAHHVPLGVPLSVLALLLYILGLVLLGIAAFSVPTGRFAAGWAGLFCWLLASLLPAFGALAR